MSTDTHKYVSEAEREARHSALAEFSRDERRPAVLLLSALLIAVLFFAIGLLVGRWTAEPDSTSTASASNSTSSPSASPAAELTPQPITKTSTNTEAETSPTATRGFALLVATYDAPEKAQSLIKVLQEAGYTDVRTTTPRAGETRPRYSVIVGHYTKDEARDAVQRIRSAHDPRLKNAKVIEDSGQ
jgi:cytoskeletal protein RodZ